MRTSMSILTLCASMMMVGPAHADDLSFAQQVGIGVGLESFERVPSARYARLLEAWAATVETPWAPSMDSLAHLPAQSRGLNGVVLFDYDGDGDTDIFATNGPGADNGLFANQLSDTGSLSFVDVTAAAGVATHELDASGACYGDIDNDGDPDLVVVGFDAPHVVFENRGDGTFADASASAGLGSGGLSGSSCVLGDVDNDSLLDIFVSHSWDQNRLFSCFSPDFPEDIQPNELFLNVGGNQFADVSDTSGVRQLGGLPLNLIESQGSSWSAALVDYDLDGDVDLFTTDDQCGLAPAQLGGVDRGFVQLWANDGTGQFINVTVSAGLNIPGAWMGISVADYDRDGLMDFFATNFGDWFLPTVLQLPLIPPYGASRWLFGNPDGTYTDPGVGDLITTPFGWGTVSQDLDNDGDTDVAYYGDIHVQFHKTATNPGTILVGDGSGNFSHAAGALDVDHRTRQVHGVAAGDLDGDGRVDLVTSANTSTPPGVPLVPYTALGVFTGSPFDAVASFEPLHFPIDSSNTLFAWSGLTFDNGGLMIELNTTENSNRSISVSAQGSVGLAAGASVNRSGIGAIVSVTPEGGVANMLPVTGGSSHLSQNAEACIFGLGEAARATVDVLWPGGVRNRLYDVAAGSSIIVHEVPCSFDDPTVSDAEYAGCVTSAVGDLHDRGAVGPGEAGLIIASALRARHAP